MAKKKKKSAPKVNVSTNGITSFFTPFLIAILGANLAGGLGRLNFAPNAVFFGILGLVSWFMGMNRYGLAEMGLRGKRPLLSGIGFAVLGWLAFVIIRFFTVAIAENVTPESLSQTFFYLLIFEAFCVQLWAFGLCFRAFSDWFGAVPAAFISGLVFGLVGTIYFQESFGLSILGPLYFIAWGIFYGFVRLRTGSLIGMVLVQAMQSLIAWHLLKPPTPLMPTDILAPGLYLGASAIYALLIWRLWPKEADDVRL